MARGSVSGLFLREKGRWLWDMLSAPPNEARKDRLKMIPRACSFILLIIFSASLASPTQTESTGKTAARFAVLARIDEFQRPAEWRQNPVDIQKQPDPAPPNLRQARNQFFTRHLPPLGGQAPWVTPALGDELLPARLDLWAVVRFDSFTVVEVTPRGPMYTEEHFTVEDVLLNKSAATVDKKMKIDVCEMGGTRVDEQQKDGKLAYQVDQPYSFRPLHRYLVQLAYFPDGSFFSPIRKWDLTDGVAIPDDQASVQAYYDNRNQIGAASASDAVMKARFILQGATGERMSPK